MFSSHAAFVSTHSSTYEIVVLAVRVHSLDVAASADRPGGRTTPLAALASSILAAVTRTAISKPMLSTTIWRFLPSTFLALSRPRCSPPEVVSTDWLSTLAEVRGE